MYCSILQCIAVYCNVLQCIAVYCSVLQSTRPDAHISSHAPDNAVYCSILQHIAAYCSIVPHIAACRTHLELQTTLQALCMRQERRAAQPSTLRWAAPCRLHLTSQGASVRCKLQSTVCLQYSFARHICTLQTVPFSARVFGRLCGRRPLVVSGRPAPSRRRFRVCVCVCENNGARARAPLFSRGGDGVGRDRARDPCNDASNRLIIKVIINVIVGQ